MVGREKSYFDPQGISKYFDEFGVREWERLTATPVDEVSLHIHSHYLRQHIREGQRVLEIGAGAGRFTQVLGTLGARVLVADISDVQLELNRHNAEHYGFADVVEGWEKVDICAMEAYPDSSFDSVVAYGGPLSYVLDRRDQALQECIRVLKAGGSLLISVMSLWGTAHRHLVGVMDMPVEVNRKIVDSGDISPETFPDRQGNFMHLFRAGELRAWLQASGLEILVMSACGCLSTGWEAVLGEKRRDQNWWDELLRMEVDASAERESLNMGTHIIAVAQKQ